MAALYILTARNIAITLIDSSPVETSQKPQRRTGISSAISFIMRERTSLVARLGKLPTRPLSPVGVADECFEEPRRQPAGMPENTSSPFSTAKGCFKKKLVERLTRAASGVTLCVNLPPTIPRRSLAMFSDVHRHLVLCMKPLHGHKPRFRQIVVIKTDVFELRILEGEAVQLDQQAIANAAAEIHAHEALAPAVAHAEKEYIASVRRGWRAFDPSAPSSLHLARSQAA